MSEITIPLDAGAPPKKLEEATATFLAGIIFGITETKASSEARLLAIIGAFKHRNFTRDTVRDTITYTPSLAQQVVAAAQAAGIVEGDVMARLTVKDPKVQTA